MTTAANSSLSRPASPPRLESRALLGNAREVHIHHNGETYRLCLTRQGKLILVK